MSDEHYQTVDDNPDLVRRIAQGDLGALDELLELCAGAVIREVHTRVGIAARVSADTGERVELDDAIKALGYDRAELLAEIADEDEGELSAPDRVPFDREPRTTTWRRQGRLGRLQFGFHLHRHRNPTLSDRWVFQPYLILDRRTG